MITKKIHPSLVASAIAGALLLTLNTVSPLPWLAWAVWGALTVIAIIQAVRR